MRFVFGQLLLADGNGTPARDSGVDPTRIPTWKPQRRQGLPSSEAKGRQERQGSEHFPIFTRLVKVRNRNPTVQASLPLPVGEGKEVRALFRAFVFSWQSYVGFGPPPSPPLT